jgi:hypothetical protein
MPRHKSRGRRTHKGRAGTRKQAGGFLHLLNPLNWFKKTDPATTMVTGGVPAAPPTPDAAAPGATPPTPDAAAAAPAPSDAPPTPDAAPGAADPAKPSLLSKLKFWGGGSRKKSRKTRHRRRRHHRK